MKKIILIIAVLIIFIKPLYAEIFIDIDIICEIESAWNEKAKSNMKALGLAQITPICLLEYNQRNRTKYKLNDLYNPQINMHIASWYINERIPAFLKYFKIEDTIINRLICYNAGFTRILKYQKRKWLPEQTRKYIEKYYKFKRSTLYA